MAARLTAAEARRLGVSVKPAARPRQSRKKPAPPAESQALPPGGMTVTIPDFLPLSINEMLRMKPGHRSRVLKAEGELVAGYFIQARIPHATTKRRVHLTFAAPEGRGEKVGDPDARLKSLLDYLVRAGALVDDSAKWVETPPPTLERGKKRTVIVLEDIGDA